MTRTLVLALSAALALGACSSRQRISTEKALAAVLIPPEQEKQLGLQVKEQLEQKEQIRYVTDPAVDGYVQRVSGKILASAKQDPAGFEPYAQQIAGMFRKDHPVLEELLDGLFHIAKADGGVHEAEMAYLKRVGAIFGFDEGEFARIRESHLGPDKADPYTILGTTRAAGNDQIKASWRKLVRDNHPDKLIAQGMPKEFVALANEKLATINAAYDKISKERGIN